MMASGVSRRGGYYQRLLKWFTTTDLTADEVHQLGLANVDRIHDEMRSIMDRSVFRERYKSFLCLFGKIRSCVTPTPMKVRAVLGGCAITIARMEEKLPEYFGVLPKLN